MSTDDHFTILSGFPQQIKVHASRLAAEYPAFLNEVKAALTHAIGRDASTLTADVRNLAEGLGGLLSLRAAGVAMPSSPKPISRESGVLIVAPTGKPLASVATQSLALGALPAGAPGVVHPSRRDSNDVVVPSG